MESEMTETDKLFADTAKHKNETSQKTLEAGWPQGGRTGRQGAGNRVFSPFVTDLKLYI